MIAGHPRHDESRPDAGRAPFALREYEPGDEQGIQELYEAVYGRSRPLEQWSWWYREAPGGPGLIHVVERDGRILGHLGHIAFSAWVDGRLLRLGHGSGTMVHPEHQGQGGMRMLVEGFLGSEHGFDLRLNSPTDRAAVLMQRYGGGRHLGRLPKWVRFLGRVRELPFPLRAAPGAAFRAYGAAASWPGPRLAVETIEQPGEELDALARSSASFAPCIRVRDAEYVTWRWLRQPRGRWHLTGVRTEAGALGGFAVHGTEESPYGRRGRIVDLLALDAEATRALVCDAFDRLAGLGCERVVFDYHDPRSWARRALLRSGFLPWRGDINLICGSLSARAGALPERMEAWYLTRGDTDRA